MALVEELLEQLESYEDAVTMLQSIEDYFDLAADDDYYFDLLMDLADRLGRRGFVQYRSALLEQLWQIQARPDLVRTLAKNAMNIGDYEKGFDWFLRIQDHWTHQDKILIAEILGQLGHKEEAKNLLKEILKLDPTFYPAYQALAQIAYDQGETDKAIEYLQVLLTYFNQKIDSNQVRLELLTYMLDSEVLSEDQVKKTLDPLDLKALASPSAYLLAARLWLLIEDYQKARSATYEAKQLDPDAIEAGLIDLEIARNIQDPALLDQAFTWLVKTLPDFDPLLIHLTYQAQQTGWINEALVAKLTDYLPLIEDLDDLGAVVDLLSHYYFVQEDLQGLLGMIQTVDLPSELLANPIAKLALLKGDDATAGPALAQALDQGAKDPDLAYELARLFQRAGEQDQVDRILDQYQATYYDSDLLKNFRQERRAQHDQS